MSNETSSGLDDLFRYLEILQAGRVKPDTKSGKGGVVSDSLDNYPDICAIKNKINSILDLEIKKHEVKIPPRNVNKSVR